MNSIYSKYFQKSRSFLYPILGIKKGSYATPVGTYIAIENLIDPDDVKLICTYKEDDTEDFKTFEEQMLITNPLFDRILELDGYKLYVFDLKVYESDWFNFLLGKYSKLSSTIKRAIKIYYGEKSAEYKYMDTYLHPEKYFEDYAKILDVDVKELKKIGELCDPCDLDKETLKVEIENLQILKKDN